ncbi:hypothetical protein GCM10027594_11030 [Hymenobacter agri]
MSGGYLKLQAFLPVPGRDDVSVLRLDYTDANNSKEHMKTLHMNGQTYVGLAVLKCSTVYAANPPVDDAALLEDAETKWRVSVVPSPMEGVPTHAHLLYNKPVEKGKIAVALQQIVKRIIQGANVFIDPSPGDSGWNGATLAVQE